MLHDFQKLLIPFEGYGLTQDQDNPYMVTLEIESLPVYVCYLEESDLVLVQCAVGVFPEGGDAASRERLLSYLLYGNNLFSLTSGATLGYDPERLLFTLQIAWPLANLVQGDAFENFIFNFLETAGSWMALLRNAESMRLPEAAQTSMPEHLMLRV
ncbi:MAG: type III secretion system chaperone [Mailhella sp.]|nr:type III secretion system chaperone [Mailhella sp.]